MTTPSNSRILVLLRDGYDRKSAMAAGLLASVYLGVGFLWADLVRQNLRDVNWLLIGIWAGMSALLCWRVKPGRDSALAGIALVGGLAFEWWGTQTRLWHYFTGESPPIWILPAWPVAALATVRLARGLEHLVSELRLKWRAVYWVTMAAFAGGMVHFIWPSIDEWPSIVACGCIGLVMVTSTSHRSDLCLFTAGTCLGWFLEYWGTTRECWTYYTGATPPLITVAAHGFAQLCYARVFDGLARMFRATSQQPRRGHPT